jgi:hypothetical protein
VRWSDDGEEVVEPVSEEHRRTAGTALVARAARRKGSDGMTNAVLHRSSKKEIA